jgi:hypothetical protein
MLTLSPLETDPAGITVSTYEDVTVSINTALRLATGTTSPISPSVKMIVNNGSNKTVTLSQACTVSGANVLQLIEGSELEAGTSYLLIVTFGDGGGNTQAGFCGIDCPL